MPTPHSISQTNPLSASLEVFTKEQFNYKRNNSTRVTNCLSWGTEECDCIEDDGPSVKGRMVQSCVDQEVSGNQTETVNRAQTVKFDQEAAIKSNRVQQKVNAVGGAGKVPQKQQSGRNRAQTAVKRPTTGASSNRGKKASASLAKFEKTEEQLQKEREEKEHRREKISNYIESLMPYSRTLTNSKFQHFFQKSAPEAYGNANTSQPIGGVVYGNNLRSFNVNPHDYQNDPKHYQSHTTAMNFAVRAKRNEQKHWNRLQKQLGKKLNLHEQNQTLREGKEVVYVDVTDENMYQIMKENNQFKKEHRDQIRQSENEFKRQKELQFKAEQEKFYRNKAAKIEENLSKTLDTTYQCDREDSDRVSEQVIYRHVDENGNVRLGADRHALTCFVDLNFPENDHLYTEELKRRMPIYQTEVEERHKHLDWRRRDNFVKAQDNVYPPHYLLPCNEQPEVQKMLMQKGRDAQTEAVKMKPGRKL